MRRLSDCRQYWHPGCNSIVGILGQAPCRYSFGWVQFRTRALVLIKGSRRGLVFAWGLPTPGILTSPDAEPVSSGDSQGCVVLKKYSVFGFFTF